MKKTIYSAMTHCITMAIAIVIGFSFTSCIKKPDALGTKISVLGEIDQFNQTKVTDQGFQDEDVIGVYVVDYTGSTPGTLLLEGNRADNVKHTFNTSLKKWTPAKEMYWKDNQTNVDIYAYYPYNASLASISDYSLEIQADQSGERSNGTLGGYEASDFLWGKAADVAPTEEVITISLRHIMSCMKITLVEGEGFATGEWAAFSKSVEVINTKRSTTINLATGVVTATGAVSGTGTIPFYTNGSYRTIVAPQQIAKETSILKIKVGEIDYLFAIQNAFTLDPGKQYNFTIEVNLRVQNDVDFDLIGWDEEDFEGTVS